MANTAKSLFAFRACATWLLVAALVLNPLALIPRAFADESSPTQLSLWVYPIGKFSDPATVSSFIASFNKQHPEISVDVEYLNYESGDDLVSTAIDSGTAPDVVMEGPERIVSNWGAKGVMAEISDLWTDEATNDITADGNMVMNACKGPDGTYYEYPLCKTAHCMAINYELFEKAGTLQYLDLQNRTWTTEGFENACKAIAASGLVETPGIVYCGGQGGDQGTRALVSNLYGASFTNAEHTAYTIDSAEGVQALSLLKTMTDDGSLSYNTDIQASEELSMFASGKSAMSFAWNSSNEENYAAKTDFTPYAMAFPTDQAEPSLCSGIWGFGVFDNGGEAKIEASKTFIRFLCDDQTQGRESVRATSMFPARASFKDAYNGTSDEKRIEQYGGLLKYASDYYNITPGWAAQRTVWWNMLQQVFSGTDPRQAATWYTRVANRAVNATVQSPVASIGTQQSKHALFISSGSISDPTVEDQISGVEEGLGGNVNLHVEFMDSSLVNDDAYIESFYRYVSSKYASIGNLGAIIVGDDNALQMVIRYQNDFFRNIPVVYESAKSKTLTELASSLGMLGVPTRDTIEDNLNLARRLYPHATKILAITDDSATGKTLGVHLQAVKSKYEPLAIEMLDTSKSTPDQIVDRIEAAGDDTIMLYLSFSKDVNGKSYPYEEALRLITGHASIPVFTLAWLGCGTLGGICADSKDMARRAGGIACGFLNEDTPSNVLTEQSDIPTIATFDYAVMSNFGLKKSSLPAQAVFVNDYEVDTSLIAIVMSGISMALVIVVIFVFKELRRRKSKERELEKMSETLRSEAEIDVLTGLGNRRLFDREIRRSEQSGRSFTLFILDIDNFKQINDSYGHLVGDMVLHETGKRLVKLSSRSFVPYRYGGDEFGIMVFCNGPDDSFSAQNQISGLFDKPIFLQDTFMDINASVGSASFPDDAATADGLISCADHALYIAKSRGKNRAVRYHP